MASICVQMLWGWDFVLMQYRWKAQTTGGQDSLHYSTLSFTPPQSRYFFNLLLSFPRQSLVHRQTTAPMQPRAAHSSDRSTYFWDCSRVAAESCNMWMWVFEASTEKSFKEHRSDRLARKSSRQEDNWIKVLMTEFRLSGVWQRRKIELTRTRE